MPAPMWSVLFGLALGIAGTLYAGLRWSNRPKSSRMQAAIIALVVGVIIVGWGGFGIWAEANIANYGEME